MGKANIKRFDSFTSLILFIKIKELIKLNLRFYLVGATLASPRRERFVSFFLAPPPPALNKILLKKKK